MTRKRHFYRSKRIPPGQYEMHLCCDGCSSDLEDRLPSNRQDAFQVEFSTAEILGIPALFTQYRIDADTLPKGLYSYEVRGNDSLISAVEIAPDIVLNFMGTIIVCEDLVPDKTQPRWLRPDEIDMYGRSAYLRDWRCVYGI